MRFAKEKVSLHAFFLIAWFCFGLFSSAIAASIDELRQHIDTKSQEIQKIEEEIRAFRETLAAKEQESQSLKNEISRIDLTLKKLASDARLTNLRIARTKLEIEEIGNAISGKEHAIARSRENLGEILAGLARTDETEMFMILSRYSSLSSFFSAIRSLLGIERNIIARLGNLRVLKSDLESSRKDTEKKQKEFSSLLVTLRYQNELQESERLERAQLLAETRNQERRYQTLLKEQEARREALEEEIREIEGKIKMPVDPASLPPKRSGILGSPLSEIALASCWNGGEAVKNCITQFFGLTSFAAAGGYRGAGHNGVDFRAGIGTPVFSAESGAVEEIGDTDIGCRGASYGKWILIRHANNLATLYAHLSGINVVKGMAVLRGDYIGFSGKTGYATGPHLHFAAFPAAAVEVQAIRSRVCGRNMILPVAAPGNYLNPLDYL